MTARPILMSASMVQATLREIESPGTGKTQTRRVINPQPKPFKMDNGKESLVYPMKVDGRDYTNIAIGSSLTCGVITEQKLRYVVGDQLYVRETVVREETDQGIGYEVYAADHKEVQPLTKWWRNRKVVPSIHMPRWASRITLEVTDVRVERLQGISEKDALAEGVNMVIEDSPSSAWFSGIEESTDLTGDMAGWHCNDAPSAFRDLWDSLNGKPRANGIDISWDANPWIVAVSFKPRLQNVDRGQG